MEPSINRTLTFPALDSLRFVGAMAVLVTHVSFQTGVYGPSLIGTFTARLDVGVAIFFVLSGFLLSRPYFSHLARRVPLPGPRYYLWKRALRIIPTYTIAVVAALSLVPEARGTFTSQWIPNLSMTMIYLKNDLPAGLTQMWSLATEVAFYLALPILMPMLGWLCCRKGQWRATWLLIALTALASLNFVWLANIDLASNKPLWLPAFLSWFCVGMAIAVASVEIEQPKSARWAMFVARAGSVSTTCFLAALSVLLIASTPLAGPIFGAVPSHGEAATKNVLYAAVGFFVILPGVFGEPDQRIMRLLSQPIVRALGQISYGIFCIHLIVLYFVFKLFGFAYFDGHFAVVLLATGTTTIALSALIYRFVERPTNTLKRFGRPNTEPAINPNARAITI